MSAVQASAMGFRYLWGAQTHDERKDKGELKTDVAKAETSPNRAGVLRQRVHERAINGLHSCRPALTQSMLMPISAPSVPMQIETKAAMPGGSKLALPMAPKS